MAKKIISADIIDPNILKDITTDAEKLSAVFVELGKNSKDALKGISNAVKGNPLNSPESINAFEKQTAAAEEQIKVAAKLEKLKQEQLKTEREVIKTISLETKELEKNTKQQEKNFDLQKKQNSVYAQSVTRLAALKKELKELEITGRTNGKLYKALGQEFVTLNGKVRDAEEGVGEFFRNVGNYPQQLKAIQKELQGLEPGSARFNELAARAGKLKDSINDAKDATKAFASESKTQTAKTLFGQIGDDLKNLDFKGAADKSRQLATVVGSISFKEITDGIKNFGSAIVNIGRSLLANPFTLLLAGIVAVTLAIKGFFDSANAGIETLQNLRKELDNVGDATKDLSVQLEENKIQQRVLSKEITKLEGEKLKLLLNYREEYKKSLVKQRELTTKFNDDIQKEREEDGFRGTKALFEKLGGETDLTKRQKIGLIDIETEFSKNRAELEKKLQSDIALLRANGDKVDIEKRIYDWQQYYQTLDALSAENRKDELTKNLEFENLRFQKAIQDAKEQSKVITAIVTGADGKKKEIIDKQKSDENYRKLFLQLERQHVDSINRITIQRLQELENIKVSIRQQTLNDEIRLAGDSLSSVEARYSESNQKILEGFTLFNGQYKAQREENYNDEIKAVEQLIKIKQDLLELNKKNEIANIKASETDPIKLNLKLQEVNNKFRIDELTLEEEKFKKLKQLQEGYSKDTIAIRQKERKEALGIISSVTSQTQAEINKRKKAEIDSLSEQIDERKSNIERQEALAARGLQNNVEFEREELAKAELEKKRLSEEQEKREQRQIFFKAVIASLENAKSNEEALQAVSRGAAIAAISKNVAKLFLAKGDENIQGVGTATSDSIPAMLSKGESVITAKGTKNYQGLATAMNNNEVEKWVNKNYGGQQTAESYNPQLLVALKSVERAIKEKDTVNIKWDSHDTRVETLVRMGYKKTVKHVKGRPRI